VVVVVGFVVVVVGSVVGSVVDSVVVSVVDSLDVSVEGTVVGLVVVDSSDGIVVVILLVVPVVVVSPFPLPEQLLRMSKNTTITTMIMRAMSMYLPVLVLFFLKVVS
jgi:hypothetical protein